MLINRKFILDLVLVDRSSGFKDLDIVENNYNLCFSATAAPPTAMRSLGVLAIY
jgi:hypothetical protein